MAVSGSQMGRGASGTNPPPGYKRPAKGTKTVSAMKPNRKKGKK